MTDIYGNFWLCHDCALFHQGFDAHEMGITEEEAHKLLNAIEPGQFLVPNWDTETGLGIVEADKFCDGCGREFFGTFHKYSEWRR